METHSTPKLSFMENTINNSTFFEEKSGFVRTSDTSDDLSQFFLEEFLKLSIETCDIKRISVEYDDDESQIDIVNNQKASSVRLDSNEYERISRKGSFSPRNKRRSSLRKNKTESKPTLSSISEELRIRESSSISPKSVIFSSQEFAKIVFQNGNVYEGCVRDAVMHGEGKFWWSDGARYEGDFKNGRVTGKGTLFFPDNSYYTGGFCNGYPHGFGRFVPSLSPTHYTGHWKFGKKHGKGMLYYSGNSYYDGEWFDDYKQGVGFRKYADGTTYNGYWFKGKQQGEGIMHYCNNDLYKGEWAEGLPHGYGEYTWNAKTMKGLALSIENCYKGNWSNGMRDGHGVISLGMDGSYLAQEFKENLKDGAGIFVCGNGTIFERNPLFINDCVAHNLIQKSPCSSLHKIRQKSNRSLTKEPNFGWSSELLNVFPRIQPKCNPMTIPVHSSGLEIDLSYHIHQLDKEYKKWINFLIPMENPSLGIFLFSTGVPSKTPLEPIAGFNLNGEEKKLRYKLQINNDLLINLYNKYASLTCQDTLPKPLLSRLFLWQMYKDFNIHEKDISLLEIDSILFNIPDSYLETEHYPFEPIYLWQFLHCLLSVALKCYASLEYFEEHKSEGIYSEMLEEFIREFIKPNANNFSGQVLQKYSDLLPISAVYSLYESLGDPHSARYFLKNCCVKTDESPPCFMKTPVTLQEVNIIHGYNVVCPGIKVHYIPDEIYSIGKPPRQYPTFPFERDEFFTSLKMFRVLGTEKITECLIKVCPLIEKDGCVVNIEYSMVFLEFYEVLILCAQELMKKSWGEEVRKLDSIVSMMGSRESKGDRGGSNETNQKSKKKGNKKKEKGRT